jgi:hypothetical protein
MLKFVFVLFIAATGLLSAADQNAEQSDAGQNIDMAAQQQEDMKNLMKPGPEHQELAKLAGTWDVVGKCWMDPDPKKPPVEMKGTATFAVILDGRFVQQEFKGEMMGQPFIGMGVQGFDNVTRKYSSGWIDGSSTSMTKVDGISEDGGKTIDYFGQVTCPAMDGLVDTRWLHKAISDDSFSFEMFMSPSGDNTKSMELIYTRKK